MHTAYHSTYDRPHPLSPITSPSHHPITPLHPSICLIRIRCSQSRVSCCRTVAGPAAPPCHRLTVDVHVHVHFYPSGSNSSQRDQSYILHPRSQTLNPSATRLVGMCKRLRFRPDQDPSSLDPTNHQSLAKDRLPRSNVQTCSPSNDRHSAEVHLSSAHVDWKMNHARQRSCRSEQTV